MKKLLRFLAIIAICGSVLGCKKTPKADPTPQCTGEWQLSSISVKSVSYAGQAIDIYVSFVSDGNFELYQKIGQGRFRKYTGTWSLSGTTLSGVYSSGKEWGSSYEVSVDDETMTLTSAVAEEVSVYKKSSIPESVKAEAYEE